MSTKDKPVDDLNDLISNAKSEIKIFHDVRVQVYRVDVPISRIHFWKENARTMLDFALLQIEEGKSIEDIDNDTVLRFLSKERKRLKLQPLVKSIESNGVKIPIVLSTNGTLLDGNRRFFACKLIEKNPDTKDKVDEIPAYVIRNEDINEEIKYKILAEANFVDDCKVDWPLDVKAKVVSDHVDDLSGASPDSVEKEKAIGQVANIYGITRQEVRDYISTKEYADYYISLATDEHDEYHRRDVVNSRFVYFWEFVNKSQKGRAPLDRSEMDIAVPSFFELLDKEAIRNIKYVEAVARASTIGLSEELERVVASAKESDVEELYFLYQDSKRIRDKEKKVRSFRVWVQTLKKDDINDVIKSELVLLEKLISKKVKS